LEEKASGDPLLFAARKKKLEILTHSDYKEYGRSHAPVLILM